MADNVIDFSKFKNKYDIEYDDIFKNDPYIQYITTEIMIDKDYIVSTEGVQDFQSDMYMEPTGIVDVETFFMLIDDLQLQDKLPIISHIDSKMEALKKSKEYIEMKEKTEKEETPTKKSSAISQVIATLFIIFIFICTCVGLYTIIKWVLDLILKII